MPKLVVFVNSHVVITPDSFDLQKCGNPARCRLIRTLVQLCELAIQRQPCPCANPSRKGYLLSRGKALKVAPHNPSALPDLSEDLPSINEKESSLEGGAKKMADRKNPVMQL